jgi:hypothetical protein
MSTSNLIEGVERTIKVSQSRKFSRYCTAPLGKLRNLDLTCEVARLFDHRPDMLVVVNYWLLLFLWINDNSVIFSIIIYMFGLTLIGWFRNSICYFFYFNINYSILFTFTDVYDFHFVGISGAWQCLYYYFHMFFKSIFGLKSYYISIF